MRKQNQEKTFTNTYKNIEISDKDKEEISEKGGV